MITAGLSPAEEPALRESPQPPPIANTSGPTAGLAPPLVSEAETRGAASSVAWGEDIDVRWRGTLELAIDGRVAQPRV